jgi:16S rRNA (adenine1518-N6/adenine1519-N6)-dimethyltransferase
MGDNSAKKSLGQHWLVDENILIMISDYAEVSHGDKVLEIGPGKGALTSFLLDKGANVTAVEFDEELISSLASQFRQYKDQLNIVHSDIRKFDLRQMGDSYKIVANIPYYLTSNLIQIISESNNPPEMAVLLIQKEVAERICAAAGNMSILGITSQFYWDTSLGVLVKPNSFIPPPKVDSQVVILKRRTSKLFDVDEKKFFRLVKSGFSSKRKTLLNSLSGGLRVPKDEIDRYLGLAEILPSARPQELSMEQWANLYRVIEADI